MFKNIFKLFKFCSKQTSNHFAPVVNVFPFSRVLRSLEVTVWFSLPTQCKSVVIHFPTIMSFVLMYIQRCFLGIQLFSMTNQVRRNDSWILNTSNFQQPKYFLMCLVFVLFVFFSFTCYDLFIELCCLPCAIWPGNALQAIVIRWNYKINDTAH